VKILIHDVTVHKIAATFLALQNIKKVISNGTSVFLVLVSHDALKIVHETKLNMRNLQVVHMAILLNSGISVHFT
jgi:hypothetical protein